MSYEQLKWYGVPDQEARKLAIPEWDEFTCIDCGREYAKDDGPPWCTSEDCEGNIRRNMYQA